MKRDRSRAEAPTAPARRAAWVEADRPVGERIEALLAAADTRGEVKALGAWLDGPGADVRAALAARVGEDLPGKKLIRRALDRADEAQERRNPIARDEAFVCAWCGLAVSPHGRTARDHCPRCLRSLHVDVVPGDRAADCGGVLQPVGVTLRGEDIVIRYRCDRCSAERTNRALRDGDPPDDWGAVTKLSAGEAVPPLVRAARGGGG